MTEEVLAFFWSEARGETSEGFPEGVDGSKRLGAQPGFQLGEGLFDRVQIRTVRGEEHQAGADSFNRLTYSGAFVCSEIIHDHDISSFQSRHETLLDVSKKRVAIDRAIEHRGGGEAVAAKSTNEGGGLPMTMRHSINQSLAPRRPTSAVFQ